MEHESNAIRQFYTKFKQNKYAGKTAQVPERYELRHALLQEEVNELRMACESGDIIGIADGLADCLYILLGTAYEAGMLDILPALFAEVHRSNMTKLENGKPILNAAGKITKGANYQPPELEKIVYPF